MPHVLSGEELDWRDRLAAAARAADGGKLDEALRFVERARELTPDQPEPYVLGARILAAQKARDQARQFLRIALRKQPGRVDASVELAALETEPAQAEKVLRRAHAEHPADLSVLLALGELLQRCGRAADAVPLLEQVVSGSPSDVRARHALGNSLLDLQQHAAALTQFTAAARTGSGDFTRVVSLMGQCRAHLMARRYLDAEGVATGMLEHVNALRTRYPGADVEPELNTLEAVAHYLLAAALVGRQRLDRAYDAFRAASRCDPALVFAVDAEVAVQQRRGRFPASWARLATVPAMVLEHAPRTLDDRLDASYVSVAVMAAIELGDFARADALLELVSAENEVVCGARAALLLARQDSFDPGELEPDLFQQAVVQIERAEAHVDEHTRLRGAVDPDAEAALAGLLLAVDDTRRAESRIEHALELSPRHATLLTAYGIVQARSGDLKRAAECFRAALRQDPSDFTVKIRLGHTLLRLELPAPAEVEYRDVLRRAKGSIEAQAGLGQVLLSLGDAGHPDAYFEAVEAFEEALRLAATMADEPPCREGSARIGPAQRSALDYGHGLALARLYERRGDLRLLRRAHAAFERARSSPQAHPHAERAARLTAVRLSDVRGLVEDVGRWLLLVITLVLLAGVQASFFAGWPTDAVDDATYRIVTPVLLAFVVVALTLPQLRSLRLAGLELQKSADERLAGFEPLRITRDDWLLDAQRPALASLAIPAAIEGDRHSDDLSPSNLVTRREQAAYEGKSALEPERGNGSQASAYQT